MSYSLGSFSVFFNDYHALFSEDFFNFKNQETAHTGELMLQFTGTEKFPLLFTASALIYGFDKKIESFAPDLEEYTLNSENNYSLYFELGYQLVTQNDITLNFFAGCAAKESYFYNVDEFSFINLGLKAKKELKINENFSLPIHLSLVSNPENKNVFYIIGISL
jgi:hypothetical protein